MSDTLSTWFKDRRNRQMLTPIRRFMVGDMDLSHRVTTWPAIEHIGSELRSVKATLTLANNDGKLNDFLYQTWMFPRLATLEIGLEHPESGPELYRIFAGTLREVQFSNDNARFYLRDKLWEFSERTIGDHENPVVFENRYPSEIVWTLCTSYGGFADINDTTNPDIDYAAFTTWDSLFRRDNLKISCYFDGHKLAEALNKICVAADSNLWLEAAYGANGGLMFRRNSAPKTCDNVFGEDVCYSMEIQVDTMQMANRFYTYGDFNVASDTHEIMVQALDFTNINTFGLKEQTYKDSNVWHVGSLSALNYAEQQITRFSVPCKVFKIKTGLAALGHTIGDTVRLTNSFWEIGSASGWIINRYKLDLQQAACEFWAEETQITEAFQLDLSCLDGPDLLIN